MGDLMNSTRRNIAWWRSRNESRGYESIQAFMDDASDLPKHRVIHAIRNVFNAGHEVVELTYSGHGLKGSGDWCFEDHTGKVIESITFDEIANLWNKRANRKENAVLWIQMDSCFSGAWVQRQLRAKHPNIGFCVSCGPEEYSYCTQEGGFFTLEFAERDWHVAVKSGDQQVYGGKQHPQFLDAPSQNFFCKGVACVPWV